jgi:hypothetical protein
MRKTSKKEERGSKDHFTVVELSLIIIIAAIVCYASNNFFKGFQQLISSIR